MPQFNLLGMTAARYNNNNGVVTYGTPFKVGDAMTCNLELQFAEGRLYAEGSLAEILREASGGTISIGVKYIKSNAQQEMYGAVEKTRSVTYTPKGGGAAVTSDVTSLAIVKDADGHYVGFACYAPDMIDRVKKYTCFFVACAKFSPPSYSLQTKGQNITFSTPTTSGEFVPDDAEDHVILDVAVCDDENQAKAWINTVYGAAANLQANASPDDAAEPETAEDNT